MQRLLHVGAAALMLVIATKANAGQIADLQLYDGSGAPTATIFYTNADGTGGNSAYVYADPQVSAGTTNPVYYCVDLWHDNYVGQSYTITQVPSMAFANSTYTDVDNRIGWMLSQDQSTPETRAAVQLALWYTVDNKGFSMSSGDATITADYNALVSFAGYDPGSSYAADFWRATHDQGNTLYQDLVSAPTVGGAFINAVPEPGSLVLGSISVLLLAGWHFRPRRG